MILCLFSGKDDHFIFEWASTFKELGIDVVPLRVSKGWENNPAFIESITNAHYFLIIASKKNIKSRWFRFVTGFCLGKKCQLFLYLSETDIGLSPYLQFAEFGQNIHELKDYLTTTSQQKKKMFEITAAKQELNKCGFYFIPDHFFLSIKKNNIEALKLFLKAEFSPDTTTEKGVPAICFAARLGFTEICHALLNYQCNINAISNDNGNNALMDAATHCISALVKLLLEKGSDINVQSKNKQTALMLAVGRGNAEIVELLLQANADRTFRDVLGMTAEEYAKIFKYEKILALFEKYKSE